jgi:hypothetical protein
MRVRTTTGLLIALALMTGCSAFSKRSGTIQRDQATQTVPTANRAPVAGFASGDEYRTVSVAEEAEPVSLNTAQSAAQAYDRKIIQNAQLTIELDDPHAAQRQLAVIAQTHGGFIVASEATVQNTVTAPTTIVTVVMRVPAAQFTATLERIRGLGGHIPQDKTTGQDVTEEYIALEARIRTQKALEAQMLDILKRAGRISDAIEVQNQIATVRTEIERLEGRQRFLANQAALSTINVTLRTPAPVVITTTAHGFWHQVKQAFGDGIDLASNITLGIIQFVILLIPIVLLIVLPLGLLWRLARPYVSWPKKPVPAATSEATAES